MSARRIGAGGVRRPLGALLAIVALAAAAPPAREGEHEAAVRRMIRPVLTAAETVADVRIERSDPFGGPPATERGRLWYIPGRGIRYRAESARGQDVIADRTADQFQLYSAWQRVVYRGPFDRAPARLKTLVLDPDGLAAKAIDAVPERRRVSGAERAGYRLRDGDPGDSRGEWSVWVSADSKSGLPRWVAVASDIDTLTIELEHLSLKERARPSDLVLELPRGTKVESIDARDLLEGTGPQRGKGTGESR